MKTLKSYKVKIILPVGHPVEQVWSMDASLTIDQVYDSFLKSKFIILQDGTRIVTHNIIGIRIEEVL